MAAKIITQNNNINMPSTQTLFDTRPLRFAIQIEIDGKWQYLKSSVCSDSANILATIAPDAVTHEAHEGHQWSRRGGQTAHASVIRSLLICGYRVRSVALRGYANQLEVDETQSREYILAPSLVKSINYLPRVVPK